MLLPVGRLAPTPSGLLHLGNALAFGAAWLSARNAGGRVLLRIEDLDRGRARADVEAAQRADLAWLGIDWDEEVEPQSRRVYPLDRIPTYRCSCSRAERLARSCSCREGSGSRGVWRFLTPPGPVSFVDRARGRCDTVPEDDPVLMRADGEAAYPLAVVLDDARDRVTEVVRGGDLLEATAVQIRLYEALGLSPPSWLHVPLLLGADGRKLSKSHGSIGIAALQDAGWTADRVWETLLPLLGLPSGRLAEARLDPNRIPTGPFVVEEDGRIRS